VGGYDHSQIGKSLCCLSVGRSVSRSVVSRNQLVEKQLVRREEKSVLCVFAEPIRVVEDLGATDQSIYL
jgi:hypothetical protein